MGASDIMNTAEEKHLRNLATIAASGHFLTARFPENWQKWSDKKLDNFIEDHKWEPFEYWNADDIFDQIDSVSMTIFRYYEVNCAAC